MCDHTLDDLPEEILETMCYYLDIAKHTDFNTRDEICAFAFLAAMGIAKGKPDLDGEDVVEEDILEGVIDIMRNILRHELENKRGEVS